MCSSDLVGYGNLLDSVGQSEFDGQVIIRAPDRTFDDHTAQAETGLLGRFAGLDLRWAEKEVDILSECEQREAKCDRNAQNQ